MKTRLLLPAVLLAFVATGWSRTWTSSNGRKLEADFVSSSGGTVTLKRTKDRQTFELPLVKLSAEDQQWIKTASASPAVPVASGASAAAAAPLPALRAKGAQFVDPAGKQVPLRGKYLASGWACEINFG